MKTGNTGMLMLGMHLGILPQWSPVMKTGNTPRLPDRGRRRILASMEPGHEDREYVEPGGSDQKEGTCLNGARS